MCLWGVGCGLWGVGCGVWGAECGVWGGCRLSVQRLKVECSEFRVQGAGSHHSITWRDVSTSLFLSAFADLRRGAITGLGRASGSGTCGGVVRRDQPHRNFRLRTGVPRP